MTATSPDYVLWANARIFTGAGTGTKTSEGCILARNGRIIHVGAAGEAPGAPDARIIDCDGRLITPALIDCHTHLVHGGNRAHEFEMRLNGVSYAEIARSGGGIASTMRATRACDRGELVAQALPRLDRLIGEGVGTIEIKSGYGLSIGAELTMLRAARELGRRRPVRVVTSYLAAHAIPPEYRDDAQGYLNDVVLPGLDAAAGEGLVDAVDGFCETIAFSSAEIEQVFERAHALGLPVKLHAEQLSHQGGAAMAARHGALSGDHLEWLNAADARAMAAAGTVAVLLPGAYYTLRETKAPPVAALRAAGTTIAIATDCNPGTSPMTSLLMAMNMGATLFGLTVGECLRGVTSGAAQALGLAGETGIIAPGRSADLALWQAREPAELVARIGFNPLHSRYFKGQKV